MPDLLLLLFGNFYQDVGLICSLPLTNKRLLTLQIPEELLWYFNMIMRDMIPGPLRHARNTKHSSRVHPFQVSLPNPRTQPHNSSFLPRFCKLWNALPPFCFSDSYSLSLFKTKINKVDFPPSLFLTPPPFPLLGLNFRHLSLFPALPAK